MQPPCTNQVEMWPIDRPKANPGDAKTLPEQDDQQIAKSLGTQQLNHPILAGETEIILAGQRLRQALRLLGYQELPAQVLSHVRKAQPYNSREPTPLPLPNLCTPLRSLSSGAFIFESEKQ
jgi:hypothetical protein